MLPKKLKEFLDGQHVKYVTLQHSPAFTAQEIAASAHIRGMEVAKTVMVKLDDNMAMVVLPAPERVDFELLKEAAGASEARLASEGEFRDMFPECETGAMPPFGNLYGVDVYEADDLAKDEDIAFNAGSHTEMVRMSYKDFEHLVHPRIAHITKPGCA